MQVKETAITKQISNDYLTIEQASKHINLSRASVYKWIKEGRKQQKSLPVYFVMKKICVKKTELEEYSRIGVLDNCSLANKNKKEF